MNEYSSEFCMVHEDCKKSAELSRVCMRAQLETPSGQRLAKLRAEVLAARNHGMKLIKTQDGARQRVYDIIAVVDMLNTWLEI